MQVRALCEADYEPLAKMYTHYALNTVFTYHEKQANADYMRALFTGFGHGVGVAQEGEQTVGYVHIAPTAGLRRPCTMAVYLEQGYTGQGFGKALVHYGEEMAQRKGYRSVRVGVCSENAASLALFNGLGYTQTGVRKQDAVKFGRALDTVMFEKELTDGR